jgi:hypothetical protein
VTRIWSSSELVNQSEQDPNAVLSAPLIQGAPRANPSSIAYADVPNSLASAIRKGEGMRDHHNWVWTLTVMLVAGPALAAEAEPDSTRDTPQSGAPAGNAVTGSLDKGLKAIGSIFSAILNPTAAEFKRKVSEGGIDDALAIYEKNTGAIRTNKDLDADVKELLRRVRIARANDLEQAVASVAASRESKALVGDPILFSAKLKELDQARNRYTSVKLIADFSPQDPNLQKADAERQSANESVISALVELYAAFPHDRVAFVETFPSVSNEHSAFRSALPQLSARLSSLDDEARQRFVRNTATAWRQDPALKTEVANIVLSKIATESHPVSLLKASASLEAYGLSRSDASTIPSVLAIAHATARDAPKVEFKAGIDVAKSAGEAIANLSATSPRSIVVAVVDETSMSRKITDKKDVPSSFVSGQRRVPNPQYEIARLNCAKAQTDAASQRARNAFSAPTSGLGALLQGLAAGLSEAGANQACQKFAATPPLLDEDVLATYTYVVSDVEVTKSVKGRLLVVEPSKDAVESFPFSFQDRQAYKVAYGRKATDQSGSPGTIADEELEKVSTAGLSLDFAGITKDLRVPERSTHERSQLIALLEPATQLATPSIQAQSNPAATVAATAASMQTMAAVSGKAAVESAAASDVRLNSVVVVLNPKGSLGSGFYVERGLILTNYHVVEGASTVELRGFEGDLFTGRVVRKDIQYDLALVKVERPGPPVQFSNTVLRAGETVEAIGHPKGLTFSLTRGTVSAVRQMKGALAEGGDKALLIQTDTAINPGNSGGPLFLGEKLVGVNTMKAKGSEGIGFALHYTEIVRFLSEQ